MTDLSELVYYNSIVKLVTGGQTGVDRASLDVALARGIPCGGWCPRGRIAEDGIIHEKYPLTETESPDPSQRTELNVRDSDATLVLWDGRGVDGTKLTIECAQKYARPLIRMNPSQCDRPRFEEWVRRYKPKVLNIAGPRESTHPGIYQEALRFLMELFPDLAAADSLRKREP